MPPDRSRAARQDRWLDLTRRVLPALADVRGWPVSADHCFQRIFLDTACGGVWYDHVAGRPAYARASDAVLDSATALAQAAADGTLDLAALNARSLGYRRTRRRAR